MIALDPSYSFHHFFSHYCAFFFNFSHVIHFSSMRSFRYWVTFSEGIMSKQGKTVKPSAKEEGDASSSSKDKSTALPSEVKELFRLGLDVADLQASFARLIFASRFREQLVWEHPSDVLCYSIEENQFEFFSQVVKTPFSAKVLANVNTPNTKLAADTELSVIEKIQVGISRYSQSVRDSMFRNLAAVAVESSAPEMLNLILDHPMFPRTSPCVVAQHTLIMIAAANGMFPTLFVSSLYSSLLTLMTHPFLMLAHSSRCISLHCPRLHFILRNPCLSFLSGDLNLIEFLVRRGFDVNAQVDDGTTALHLAARLGQVNAVAYLLDLGANPDLRMIDSYTPLHVAVKGGMIDTVAVLIAGGAALCTHPNPILNIESVFASLSAASRHENPIELCDVYDVFRVIFGLPPCPPVKIHPHNPYTKVLSQQEQALLAARDVKYVEKVPMGPLAELLIDVTLASAFEWRSPGCYPVRMMESDEREILMVYVLMGMSGNAKVPLSESIESGIFSLFQSAKYLVQYEIEVQLQFPERNLSRAYPGLFRERLALLSTPNILQPFLADTLQAYIDAQPEQDAHDSTRIRRLVMRALSYVTGRDALAVGLMPDQTRPE